MTRRYQMLFKTFVQNLGRFAKQKSSANSNEMTSNVHSKITTLDNQRLTQSLLFKSRLNTNSQNINMFETNLISILVL